MSKELFLLKTGLWFLIAIFTAIVVHAEGNMKGPSRKSVRSFQQPYYQTSPVKFVWKNAINLYSGYISPVDGPRSPSFPTSTQYGKQAIERHGFFIGVILIADRLIHESDVHLGPKIVIYGNRRYFDPLEANTYWWD